MPASVGERVIRSEQSGDSVGIVVGLAFFKRAADLSGVGGENKGGSLSPRALFSYCLCRLAFEKSAANWSLLPAGAAKVSFGDCV